MKEKFVIEISKDELICLMDAISSANLPTKRNLMKLLKILKTYE